MTIPHDRRFGMPLGATAAAANDAMPPGLLERARHALGGTAIAADGAPLSAPRVDFTARDPLNLSGHPRLQEAALAAIASDIEADAPQSPTSALEARLADLLSLKTAHAFASGAAANAAVIRALVQPTDLIFTAARPPAGLLDAAAILGAEVIELEAFGAADLDRALSDARSDAPGAGLLVALRAFDHTQCCFADLRALQETCAHHRATLLVDATDDMGLIGPTGRGVAELQGMLGRVDIVTGDLSPVFGVRGGYAASNHPAWPALLATERDAARVVDIADRVASAVATAALDLSDSAFGARARRDVLGNANWLGAALTARGFDVAPQLGAEVTVTFGSAALAARMWAALSAQSLRVETRDPASCVFRLSAAHSPGDLAFAVKAAVAARDLAQDPSWQVPSAEG